jgi:purine-binding chemotaxis protein CheW
VHVRLRVGDELYAVPIENVVEVAELDDVAAVPGARPHVLGLRNVHGQVLPVFDLATLLHVRREVPPSFLVVADEDGQRAGFAVDGVTKVAPFEAEPQETELAHLTHARLEDGALVGVIDMRRLFGALRQEAP